MRICNKNEQLKKQSTKKQLTGSSLRNNYYGSEQVQQVCYLTIKENKCSIDVKDMDNTCFVFQVNMDCRSADIFSVKLT